MNAKHTQFGFTYFGALFIVALIGLALSGAALTWQVLQQREKEAELLFIGQQYINAIASYYHAAPGGGKQYPRRIADLLRDPRYLVVKHHLRKPWRDPMNGGNWGLIYTRQGGIAGIYSLAQGVPLKQKGFDMLEDQLSGKASYREWKFVYIPAADSAPNKNSMGSEEEIVAPAVETPNGADPDEDNGEEETGAELLKPE